MATRFRFLTFPAKEIALAKEQFMGAGILCLPGINPDELAIPDQVFVSKNEAVLELLKILDGKVGGIAIAKEIPLAEVGDDGLPEVVPVTFNIFDPEERGDFALEDAGVTEVQKQVKGICEALEIGKNNAGGVMMLAEVARDKLGKAKKVLKEGLVLGDNLYLLHVKATTYKRLRERISRRGGRKTIEESVARVAAQGRGLLTEGCGDGCCVPEEMPDDGRTPAEERQPGKYAMSTNVDLRHTHTVTLDENGNGDTTLDHGHTHVVEDWKILAVETHDHELYYRLDETRVTESKPQRLDERRIKEEKEPPQFLNTQWSNPAKGIFFPAARVTEQIPPGYYSINSSMQGTYFAAEDSKTAEGLLRFPDSGSDEVIDTINNFWGLGPKFEEHNQPYKRGIMLYGPPGGGKTCTIRIVVENLIKKSQGIVVDFPGPSLFVEGHKILRQIHPEMPLVVLMEDIDAILRRCSESQVLNLLDGMHDLYRVVFLASTNYPEKLGSRIMNRPSRFDRKYLIGMPSAESREIFVRHKLKTLDETTEEEIKRWVEDTEGMSIAHINELFVATKILGDPYEKVIEILGAMKVTPASSTFDEYKVMEDQDDYKILKDPEERERYLSVEDIMGTGKVYEGFKEDGGKKLMEGCGGMHDQGVPRINLYLILGEEEEGWKPLAVSPCFGCLEEVAVKMRDVYGAKKVQIRVVTTEEGTTYETLLSEYNFTESGCFAGEGLPGIRVVRPLEGHTHAKEEVRLVEMGLRIRGKFQYSSVNTTHAYRKGLTESVGTDRSHERVEEQTEVSDETLDDVFDNIIRKLIILGSIDALRDVDFDEDTGSIYLFMDASMGQEEVAQIQETVNGMYQGTQIVATPTGQLPEETEPADWWVVFVPQESFQGAMGQPYPPVWGAPPVAVPTMTAGGAVTAITQGVSVDAAIDALMGESVEEARGPVNPITVRGRPSQEVRGGSWEAQVVLDFDDLKYVKDVLQREAGGPIALRQQGSVLEIYAVHDTKTAAEGTIRRWKRAVDKIVVSFRESVKEAKVTGPWPKSKGHLAFLKGSDSTEPVEYYTDEKGELWRAPVSNVIDTRNGYRIGRWEAPAHMAQQGFDNAVRAFRENLGEARLRLKDAPDFVQDGVARFKREGEQGATWTYFQGMNANDKKELDDWLLKIKHPSVYQPGTNEQRFREIVRELAAMHEEVITEGFNSSFSFTNADSTQEKRDAEKFIADLQHKEGLLAYIDTQRGTIGTDVNVIRMRDRAQRRRVHDLAFKHDAAFEGDFDDDEINPEYALESNANLGEAGPNVEQWDHLRKMVADKQRERDWAAIPGNMEAQAVAQTAKKILPHVNKMLRTRRDIIKAETFDELMKAIDKAEDEETRRLGAAREGLGETARSAQMTIDGWVETLLAQYPKLGFSGLAVRDGNEVWMYVSGPGVSPARMEKVLRDVSAPGHDFQFKGKEHGRLLFTATYVGESVEEAVEGLDLDAFERGVALVQSEIDAPHVRAFVSTLGGNERPALMINLSLDPKETWSHGIYQNSRYLQLDLAHTGGLELVSQDYRMKPKFRKLRVKSVPDAIQKINRWIGRFGPPVESVDEQRQQWAVLAGSKVSPWDEETTYFLLAQTGDEEMIKRFYDANRKRAGRTSSVTLMKVDDLGALKRIFPDKKTPFKGKLKDIIRQTGGGMSASAGMALASVDKDGANLDEKAVPKMSVEKALVQLVWWATGSDRTGNPYRFSEIRQAIRAVGGSKDGYDLPPREKIKGKQALALWDLAKWGTGQDRPGNPYTKPQVKAAIKALGGKGLDLPKKFQKPVGESVTQENLDSIYDDLDERDLKISTKTPAQMKARAINTELDQLAKESSKLGDEFIAAGRGHEKPSVYLKKSDSLALRARALFDRQSALRHEVEMRAGPRQFRLPLTGKRGEFGPRESA